METAIDARARLAALLASAGRLPDGADADSNCTDFLVQPATRFAAASDAGPTSIKLISLAGFSAGQRTLIDSGASLEVGEIAEVGTAGSTGTYSRTPRR